MFIFHLGKPFIVSYLEYDVGQAQ